MPPPAGTPASAPRTVKAGGDPYTYFVQAGAFQRTEDAEQQRARLLLLGMQAKVGIAERSDRLVSILFMTGLADLLRHLGVDDGVLWLIPITLGVLAVASTVTVVQRMLEVRRQALDLV